MKQEIIHADCRFFKGDRPCTVHKKSGVHCENCDTYEPINRRILIIKLGAVGDVIRTTPLLRVFNKPGVHITWLTETPEILPHSRIDRILKLDAQTLAYLSATPFDAIYNLDKDDHAVALCKLIEAQEKYGFTIDHGVCVPVDDIARPKWLTGLFDDLNQKNKLSYLEEIFTICGLKFQGEKYVAELDDSPPFNLNLPRPLIGLNTGCGARWTARLWKFENWETLARMLMAEGFGVLLLGGPDEDEKNRLLAYKSGARYAGHHPFSRFYHLVNEVDVLVTGVTMAMHMGIALEKRLVLLNNIFNKHEFEMYGLGRIIEPDVDCLGCFKPVCEEDCMNMLEPDEVFEAVAEEVGRIG